MSVSDEKTYVDEVLRLHERYTREVVEAMNICPWAQKARTSGAWRRRVLLQSNEELEPALAAIEALEREGPTVEVAILIFPRLALPYARFDEFAQRLRQADQDRHGGRPIFVAATFHPEYPLEARTPAQLVPYLRRSPHPSIQVIRLAVIEAARGDSHGEFVFDFSPEAWAKLERRQNEPSVTERITRDNHERFLVEGRARLEAIYADLMRERQNCDMQYTVGPKPPGDRRETE